jgi:hypothetical protein
MFCDIQFISQSGQVLLMHMVCIGMEWWHKQFRDQSLIMGGGGAVGEKRVAASNWKICDKGQPQFFNTFLLISQNISPFLIPIISKVYYVYKQFTIGVGVNNNHFEYWSSNYLGYTMSYTSTCPITYFTPTYVTN